MPSDNGVETLQRVMFNAIFAADWLLGPANVERLLPRRWDSMHGRLLKAAPHQRAGRELPVERRRNLDPDEFRTRFFLPGVPVVLESAAANWPAIHKWSPDYLLERCGGDEVAVLDGQTWTVNNRPDTEAVSASESMLKIADLLQHVRSGGGWYGAFLDLLDQHADLRADLDMTFVCRFGHTNLRLPWHRNVLASNLPTISARTTESPPTS